MKDKKVFFLIVVLIILICLIFFIKCLPNKKELSHPSLIIENNKIITISLGEKYQEDGYRAYDKKDGNLTKKVKIISDINYNKEGSYQILYQVKNSSGIKAEARRYIIIKNYVYKEEYDSLNSKTRVWWNNNKHNNKRPLATLSSTKLKPYNAYYIGDDDKTIYLTFNENKYIKETYEILEENKIKGTFFITSSFLYNNKSLTKKLEKNGHLIGNMTSNYSNIPNLSSKTDFNILLNEIKDFEVAYYEVIGKNNIKIFRFPNFEWSYRSLQIMKDLDYKTYFHSADLETTETSTKEFILNEFVKSYHNGAIFYVDVFNKDILEGLNNFIKIAKNEGYNFKLLTYY